MKSTRKVLLLSAALVLGSALGASAADLGYGGSLKDAPTMAPMPAASTGWYARIDGGYNWTTQPDVYVDGYNTSNVKSDDAWSIGGGIGRYFGHGFRGDLTIDHLFNADISGHITDSCGCDVGDFKSGFNSTVFLANLYYDFNRGGRFIPYVGAGIGFAHNKIDGGTVESGCGCVATYDGGSDTNFAAAAMAGFAWKIRGGEPTYVGGLKDGTQVAVSDGRALYLDVGYRYLWLGDVKSGDLVFAPHGGGTPPPPPADPKFDNIGAHELRVGLRYDFN